MSAPIIARMTAEAIERIVLEHDDVLAAAACGEGKTTEDYDRALARIKRRS